MFTKGKLNVSNRDVSDGRKPSKSKNTIASPGLTKIQEMIDARSKNSASYKGGSSVKHGSVSTKKKRGLQLNKGRLPVEGAR